MLPNVWSVLEFQKQSKLTFSTGRSPQLVSIDQALGVAHAANMQTGQGAEALIKLVEAITAWQKAKALKGKSGREKPVAELLGQVQQVSEALYRDRTKQQNLLDKQMQDMRNKNMPGKGLIPPGIAKTPPGINQPKIPTPPPLPFANPMNQRNGAEDRLFDMLAQAMLHQRRKVMAFDDEDLFEDLDVRQQGRLAAQWMLAVPDSVVNVDAARGEALRILGMMLGNNVSVIRKLFSNNMEVVVVPRDQGMTVLEQFESIRGKKTFDGRDWDTVRGVGNSRPNDQGHMAKIEKELKSLEKSGKKAASIVAIDPKKGRIYTAITEENLLGGTTTAPGAGCYAPGYSTTTHEFAHAIHGYGLTVEERRVITDAFTLRTRQGDDGMWVDGPRKVGANQCYASMNEYEYFAQLSNAWLGVNKGTDPYTSRPRNNGKEWVIANEPRPMSNLLESVYGRTALDDLNPAVVVMDS